MIKALIFDFDGLILDTETPEVQAWKEIYAEFGVEFPIQQWGQIVGGKGAAQFDPVVYLEEQTGRTLDAATLNARYRQRGDELIALQPSLPGIREYLETARRLDLRLAIASSSSHRWVDGHLTRLGLFDYFEPVICLEDVSNTKPDPELFLKTLSALGLRPDEAIVFEDSPNGVKAARAAGIPVVAVPNPLTAQLGVDGADLTLASLADKPLGDLLVRFNLER